MIYEAEGIEVTQKFPPHSSSLHAAPEWANSLKLSSYCIPLGTEIEPGMGRPKSTHANELRGVACRGLLEESSLLPLVQALRSNPYSSSGHTSSECGACNCYCYFTTHLMTHTTHTGGQSHELRRHKAGALITVSLITAFTDLSQQIPFIIDFSSS